METRDLLEIIGALILIAGQVFVGIRANAAGLLRAPAQNRTDNADAVQSYAEATKLYADEVRELHKRTVAQDERIDNLEQKLSEKERELGQLKDWAERLVFQVKSLGHEPVPFKPEPKKKEA